jgi:membrane carboxypeptidase/penicillin-binding protein PbpC
VVEIDGRAVPRRVGSSSLQGQGGWIDMTRVRRSPGSTLKPFIYAFAFEDGFAAPDTEIDDARPASPTTSRRTSTASSTARSLRRRRWPSR